MGTLRSCAVSPLKAIAAVQHEPKYMDLPALCKHFLCGAAKVLLDCLKSDTPWSWLFCEMRLVHGLHLGSNHLPNLVINPS
jgi:hypothetical protein